VLVREPRFLSQVCVIRDLPKHEVRDIRARDAGADGMIIICKSSTVRNSPRTVGQRAWTHNHPFQDHFPG
jgi:hypothetical protein